MAVLAAAIPAVAFLPLNWAPHWIERVTLASAELGWRGQAFFVVAAAGLIAVGVPRLVLCGVAGAAFGLVWGLVWGQLASLAGSYATFALARRSGRDVSFHRWPRLERFRGFLAQRGILGVLLVRQLPLNSFYINLLHGLTLVRQRDFLIGSLLGFLPEGVPATLIGAGVIQGDWVETGQYLVLAIVCLLVLGFGLRRLQKGLGQRSS